MPVKGRAGKVAGRPEVVKKNSQDTDADAPQLAGEGAQWGGGLASWPSVPLMYSCRAVFSYPGILLNNTYRTGAQI